MTISREEALKALDDIFNYCEEIDYSIPENERSGYKMLPDIQKIRKYIIENTKSHGEWIPCSERLPETDMKVLVNLHNNYGRDVILMASHIGYHERTSEDYGWQEFEGDTEYDEENDCFWIPECWYESNYVEDNTNWIIDECEGTITHWMPLPEPHKKEGEDK